MKPSDIAGVRLAQQQLTGTTLKTPKEIVSWMGAMQAQDYNMAKWAIGVRLPGSTEATVQAAVDKGEIIRTHVLRPTWHFAPAEDIHWMLELTAPRIRTAMSSMNRQLGLTEAVFKKSNRLIEKALTGGKQLTRSELVSVLGKAGIATNEYRSGHLFLQAELEGLICSGASKGKQTTYALLDERAPKKKKLKKEEALALLAGKYFASHCPATLQDFIWWSGLPVAEAKKALELIRTDLVPEQIGAQTYWLTSSCAVPGRQSSLFLLPAYDEYLISYKDRSAALAAEDHRTAVSVNGIFHPVIAVNGKVRGMWQRTVRNNELTVTMDIFPSSGAEPDKLAAKAKKAMKQLGKFLDKKVSFAGS